MNLSTWGKIAIKDKKVGIKVFDNFIYTVLFLVDFIIIKKILKL